MQGAGHGVQIGIEQVRVGVKGDLRGLVTEHPLEVQFGLVTGMSLPDGSQTR